MATKTANTLHKAPTAVDEMSKDELFGLSLCIIISPGK